MNDPLSRGLYRASIRLSVCFLRLLSRLCCAYSRASVQSLRSCVGLCPRVVPCSARAVSSTRVPTTGAPGRSQVWRPKGLPGRSCLPLRVPTRYSKGPSAGRGPSIENPVAETDFTIHVQWSYPFFKWTLAPTSHSGGGAGRGRCACPRGTTGKWINLVGV